MTQLSPTKVSLPVDFLGLRAVDVNLTLLSS